MNEPSSFVDGSSKGCSRNKYDQPPYIPAIIGGQLSQKTICMNAQQYGGIHYNLHSIYGHLESKVTMRSFYLYIFLHAFYKFSIIHLLFQMLLKAVILCVLKSYFPQPTYNQLNCKYITSPKSFSRSLLKKCNKIILLHNNLVI